MGIFRVDHLILKIQLLCSSLGKATSTDSRLLQLPLVICVGLRPYGFPQSALASWLA